MSKHQISAHCYFLVYVTKPLLPLRHRSTYLLRTHPPPAWETALPQGFSRSSAAVVSLHLPAPIHTSLL